MIFLFLAVISIVLGIFYTLWCSTFWQRRHIKGPNGFPLIGNMFQYIIGRKQYGEVYEKLYKTYKSLNLPYVGIYHVFNKPAILLTSPEMVKEVMIRNFYSVEDNVLWINPKRDPMICFNPFVARKDKWHQMRSEIVSIFTPSKVKSVFPHIQAICQQLDNYVLQNFELGAMEAKDLFSRYTINVIASAAYGLDAKAFSKENDDLTQLVEHIFLPNPWSFLETTSLLYSPTLGNLINFHYAPLTVQNWVNKIVNGVLKKRLDVDKPQHISNDFIQWLIDAKQRQREPVDTQTIVGHCLMFLLEGFETSSSLMAFVLFELATNPQVQTRVHNEIDEVLQRFNNQLSYDAMQEMSYLEATLYETLRLHPVMFALTKQCTKSFTMPPQVPGCADFTVPKGTIFVVPAKAMHYDPVLYVEPNKFHPERFCEENQNQRASCSFLGFGAGPRMCPGIRFAITQTKAGLIALLSKYSVDLDEKTSVPFKVSPKTFLTAAHDGVWIKFKPRK